jgi:hypothetical protein
MRGISGMPQPFYLGLNMCGTVSAGAYTAGVMDFLIEAMDAWYAERNQQVRRFGDDYDRWTIPPHEVQLAVMAGASGGGITAALSAAAIGQKFEHVRQQCPSVHSAVNTLFQSWVRDIDLKSMLGDSDLNGDAGTLTSLLDSTVIRIIASKAFAISAPLTERRPWLRDGLKVILTLTNLGGIPYAVEPQTDAESARTLYHADRRQFEVLWNAKKSGGETIALNAHGGPQWSVLANTAVATSAFPVVLAPQTLNRIGLEYNQRKWNITQDDPKCGHDGQCICQKWDTMKPAWDIEDSARLETLNVDGGVVNNSPFDCARLELAALSPAMPSGHNLRDPNRADRAVISIAPLHTSIPAKLPPFPEPKLMPLLSQFLQTVVQQSRIQGEDLKLTADPQAASRWIIAPTSESLGTEPLAGSLLGAFGGFTSEQLREHDYQLGRRNCQRFLTSYFGLPWENTIMQQYAFSSETRARLAQEFAFDAESVDSTKSVPQLYPVIPVMPELRSEIKVVRNRVQPDQLGELADLAVDRLNRIGKYLISESQPGFFSELAFNAGWLFIRSKLRDSLFTYAVNKLSNQGFADRTDTLNESEDGKLSAELERLREDIVSVRKMLAARRYKD